MVDRYASSENIMFILDNTLIPRKSADFRGIVQSIEKIGATNANVIIISEILEKIPGITTLYEERTAGLRAEVPQLVRSSS